MCYRDSHCVLCGYETIAMCSSSYETLTVCCAGLLVVTAQVRRAVERLQGKDSLVGEGNDVGSM